MTSYYKSIVITVAFTASKSMYFRDRDSSKIVDIRENRKVAANNAVTVITSSRNLFE